MKKPEPKKNDFCLGCFKVKPLLMPVSLIPGWPIVVWEHRCLECRTGFLWGSAEDDRYGVHGDTYKFSHLQKQRDAYDEWLMVEKI